MKSALIIGVTGQDGSYLAEFLLRMGYQVHGLVRRSSSFNTSRIDHLSSSPHSSNFWLHHGDVADGSSLGVLISKLQPTEIYNLAAQSHVRLSFDLPVLTSEITGLGTLNILEAVRQTSPESRYYQASSSEMFGATPPPQSEGSEFYPRSPYGVSKLYSYWMTRNYREAYNLFLSNGILFNHESPRRTPTFVTRKITRAAARIKAGLDDSLILGNLEARRDWGYAPDFVAGMWMMLQADRPDDFVLSTGTSTSVEEWLNRCFELADLDVSEFVRFDERFLRPSEVDNLIGNSSKAKSQLNWETNVTPEKLLEIMLQFDMENLKTPGNVDVVSSALWDRLLG